MQKKYIIYFLLLLVFTTCKEEENIDPKVETLSITKLNARQYLIKARVVELGDYPLEEYGFNYGTSFQFGGERVINLGTQPVADTFSAVFNYNSEYNSTTLSARAYLKNSIGTVYGKIVTYEIPYLYATINSFSPTSGKSGDTITFYGQNMTEMDPENLIRFGYTYAEIIEFADNQLKVIVPDDIEVDYWDNSIYVYYQTQGYFDNIGSFTLLPEITGFTPSTGTFGDRIKITGKNLNSGYIMVKFGSTEANIDSREDTYLYVYVPYDLYEESCEISITSNSKKKVAPTEFRLLPMQFSSELPVKGFEGLSVTLIGQNFNPNTYANQIRIGGYTADVNWNGNSNEILFTVPEGLTEGLYDLIVSNGATTDTLANGFQYVEPEITGISPNSGYLNDEVTITGTNFLMGNESVYVNFGGYSAEVTSMTDSEIVTQVPSGISASEVFVKLNYYNSGLIITAPDNFTVLPAYIGEYAPLTGNPGTLITINGDGFGVDFWKVQVLFGTYEVTPATLTDNKITVQVPSGIDPGTMKLSVKVNSSVTVADADFVLTD